MTHSIKNNPGMPPMPPRNPPGTETSDAYGHVISTRPVPAPEVRPPAPAAPTSDRYGHVISTPDGYVAPKPAAAGRVTGRAQKASQISFSVHAGMQELQDFAGARAGRPGFHPVLGALAGAGLHDRQLGDDEDAEVERRAEPDGQRPAHPPERAEGHRDRVRAPRRRGVPAPSDIAGYRERSDLWLNNGGKNFRQVSQ